MMNTKSFLAALVLMVMVAACGKSMSLQVDNTGARGPQENLLANHDTAKQTPPGALDRSETLTAISKFDAKDLEKMIAVTDAKKYKRATLQVAPKEAILEILKFDLVLKSASLSSLPTSDLCLIIGNTAFDCHAFENGPASGSLPRGVNDLTVNLLEWNGLKEKTIAEQVDWIYSHSTEFADASHRKFRFFLKDFDGSYSSFEASLILQVRVDQTKMPEAFGTKPSVYVNGADDTVEATQIPAEETTGGVPAATSTCIPGEVLTAQGCLPQAMCNENEGYDEATKSCLPAIQ